MSRIAAIGESVRVGGLGLAGVLILPGDDPEAVRKSWAALPTDVTVVVLTPSAAAVLDDQLTARLTVVMPP